MTRYIARFTNGTTRTFRARHIVHAQAIGKGIARSNGWVVKSVGQV